MATRVTYTIDGTDLSDLGVYVEEASGLFSVPKRKTPVSIDWPEHHGKIVDTAAPTYDEREITLKCIASGSSGGDVGVKAGQVAQLLTGAGLHTLSVTIGTVTASYEVYITEMSDPDRTWGGDKVVGRFTIKLSEPEPSSFLP